MRPREWKAIAWNGLSLAVPGDWEPGRIGRRHLLFESESGPAMEIKWDTVKGRFCRRRQLEELARRIGRTLSTFQKKPLSDECRKSLSGYDVEGFQWDAASERAEGLLIFCPICRTASLVRFFDRPGSAAFNPIAYRILASFRDHRSDRRVSWALYDIIAWLPDAFVLERHRFEAGRFMLEFSSRPWRLILYRWAPAEVLLQKRSLADFAQMIDGSKGLAFNFLTFAGHAGIEGRDPAPAGWAARLKTRLGMTSFRRLRLWHIAERNRILGVRLEGRRPIGDSEMCELSDAYGMDHEKDRVPFADPSGGPRLHPGEEPPD